MQKSPLITLNNGVQMPALGLGVFQAHGNEAAQAVRHALQNGYRLIDTAAVYDNEEQVGHGIAESGVPRGELFVTTKLAIQDYGRDAALRAFDASLSRLGLDYVDLYLLHWPLPGAFAKTLQSWRVLEGLLYEGRVKAIGVCNFRQEHLMVMQGRVEVTPAINQVELHPYFSQQDLRTSNTEAGIVTQAWSPIGGALGYQPGIRPLPHLLEHPAIASIALAHGKSSAQTVLRWHLQHGHAVIPKSVHPARIEQNLAVFDFELSTAEMAAIDALETGVRIGPDPDLFDLDYLRMLKARA